MPHTLKWILIVLGLSASCETIAAGMLPETSLLIVNEEEQGASIDVKNTDDTAQLLYTKVITLADDAKPDLFVTQPVVRVEAGKTQRVRFVLKEGAPLKVEHLKRVIFSTIPQREKNKVKVIFSQNIPVIIRPAGLDTKSDPWVDLKWTLNAGKVLVKNNTPYVIRLEQRIKLLPSGRFLELSKSYILPGESLTAKSNTNIAVTTDRQVEIYPATRYGYKVDKFIADIK
ncbi:fimbria/pilus chaperone family protein [Citrobacter sp. Igbk 14]|uniref:fimbria/pilus chaperone family protein n=1 Tax=Citrobacter sp. Igbk 14 TaxID=2963960 RepID=UPI0023035435|nr:fimbria/pilus chaperone family protein [Citrobacter sp. Igbk 14]MDA8513297.1 fimbria/pilus chaperone family protein [Citrobacter sp. Igbk 14]